MTIFLSGGGTMGSVSPLLAVAQEIKGINPRASPVRKCTALFNLRKCLPKQGKRWFKEPSCTFSNGASPGPAPLRFANNAPQAAGCLPCICSLARKYLAKGKIFLSPASQMKKRADKARFIWIGTYAGPERKVVKGQGITFYPICAGKFRRYVSLRTLLVPFLVFIGFIQSIILILKEKPGVILSAGSFVSVPLVWAGFLCRVPIFVHQQDIQMGLANRLMAPFAQKITVAFSEQLKLFPIHKTVWIGNPVREEISHGSRDEAMRIFNLEQGLPTVLVMGGGTGAEFINKLVTDALPQLVQFCQVIHLAGKEKLPTSPLSPPLSAGGACLPAGEAGLPRRQAGLPARQGSALGGKGGEGGGRYHSYEFLTCDMPHALAAADLVVSRAGMGTMTELSVLLKPAIIIPMLGTHQEENAEFFARHGAVVVLSQNKLTPEAFVREIKNLLEDKEQQEELKKNIKELMKPGAAEAIADLVFLS